MPSSTLPSIDEGDDRDRQEAGAPPGSAVIAAASWREKPDWVSAQAMPVAAPMISRIAPDSAAVSTSIGYSRRQSNCR